MEPGESAQTYWAVVKYLHTFNGLYIWEFITTLDYEWKVIRGRLPYRWTIWIYSFTRVTALMSVILLFVRLDTTTGTRHNCQLWLTVTAIPLCMSAISATLLLLLRIIAIWNRNKVAVTLAITVWVINTVSRIQGIALLRSVQDPAQLVCNTAKTKSTVISFTPAIITDIVLLLIMLVGLLILRRHDGGNDKSGLTHFLWKQGIIWLALGIATEFPPLVLIALDLNNPINIVFMTPCVVTLTIAGTRMHRCLVDFASNPPDRAHLNLQLSSIYFLEAKQIDTAPTTLHQIETAVDAAFEQHPTAQITEGDSSDTTITSTVSPSPIPLAQSV